MAIEQDGPGSDLDRVDDAEGGCARERNRRGRLE
jgi:hypothetical protein